MKMIRVLGAVGASIAILSASAAFADEGVTGALHHTAKVMRQEGHRIHKGWHYSKHHVAHKIRYVGHAAGHSIRSAGHRVHRAGHRVANHARYKWNHM